MGFDKSDLHFVIHYQLPGNIISYYQQIGRAGRGIDKAHIVLMHGPGDDDIQRYFIETAFPTPQQVTQVIDALRTGPKTRNDLQRDVNVRFSVLEKILTHLEVEEIVEKQQSSYVLLKTASHPDYDRWAGVTQMRYAELDHMHAYVHEQTCLMRFIARALDDPTPVQACGRCKNCTGAVSKFEPSAAAIGRAQQFLRLGKPLTFEPRRRWPAGLPGIAKITDIRVNQTGLALCSYYDEGWGVAVRAGRTQGLRYEDALVDASIQALLAHWRTSSLQPDMIVPVPSLRRPTLVEDFARRLAEGLHVPFVNALEHVQQHAPQSDMRNSFQQASNVIDHFAVIAGVKGQSILLVDDVADSKWTLTVLGDLLQRHGSSAIYPFALAVTNMSD